MMADLNMDIALKRTRLSSANAPEEVAHDECFNKYRTAIRDADKIFDDVASFSETADSEVTKHFRQRGTEMGL